MENQYIKDENDLEDYLRYSILFEENESQINSCLKSIYESASQGLTTLGIDKSISNNFSRTVIDFSWYVFHIIDLLLTMPLLLNKRTTSIDRNNFIDFFNNALDSIQEFPPTNIGLIHKICNYIIFNNYVKEHFLYITKAGSHHSIFSRTTDYNKVLMYLQGDIDDNTDKEDLSYTLLEKYNFVLWSIENSTIQLGKDDDKDKEQYNVFIDQSEFKYITNNEWETLEEMCYDKILLESKCNTSTLHDEEFTEIIKLYIFVLNKCAEERFGENENCESLYVHDRMIENFTIDDDKDHKKWHCTILNSKVQGTNEEEKNINKTKCLSKLYKIMLEKGAFPNGCNENLFIYRFSGIGVPIDLTENNKITTNFENRIMGCIARCLLSDYNNRPNGLKLCSNFFRSKTGGEMNFSEFRALEPKDFNNNRNNIDSKILETIQMLKGCGFVNVEQMYYEGTRGPYNKEKEKED